MLRYTPALHHSLGSEIVRNPPAWRGGGGTLWGTLNLTKKKPVLLHLRIRFIQPCSHASLTIKSNDDNNKFYKISTFFPKLMLPPKISNKSAGAAGYPETTGSLHEGKTVSPRLYS